MNIQEQKQSSNNQNASNEFKHAFLSKGVTSLWHMTHIDNIPSIMTHGIFSHNHAFQKFNPTDISDPDVQSKRQHKKDSIYNSWLHDYVPTFFTIGNSMLSSVSYMNREICLLEISLDVLDNRSFVFTDGNAACSPTKFFNSINDIDKIQWDVIHAQKWKGRSRERAAEVLISHPIKSDFIQAIHCYSFDSVKKINHVSTPCFISQNLYFSERPKKQSIAFSSVV